MSIATCHVCGDWVDTDANPDAFVDIGRGAENWQAFCDECKPEYGGNDQAIAAKVEAKMREKEPKMCDECGEEYADPPSKLCPGCEAYREHTGAI